MNPTVGCSARVLLAGFCWPGDGNPTIVDQSFGYVYMKACFRFWGFRISGVGSSGTKGLGFSACKVLRLFRLGALGIHLGKCSVQGLCFEVRNWGRWIKEILHHPRPAQHCDSCCRLAIVFTVTIYCQTVRRASSLFAVP